MNTKLILAAAASALLVTACGVGQNLNFKNLSLGGAEKPAVLDEATGRIRIMGAEEVCPDCCVAVVGTSHFTVFENTYNFEINTASGRVNSVVLTNAAGSQTFFPIISARCLLDTNGNLIGATIEADSDGNTGTVEGVFTLVGDTVGGHVKTTNISATVTGGFPFDSFNSAAVNTGENIFIDNGCDGTPN